MNNEEYHQLRIVRRPWYGWVTWGLWLFFEVMFFQAAVASGKELEPRAAVIYWLMFGVLLLGAIIFVIIRHQELI